MKQPKDTGLQVLEWAKELQFICQAEGGCFQSNMETTESGYFSAEELPPLAEEKNSQEQIEMCFAASLDENWKVRFD